MPSDLTSDEILGLIEKLKKEAIRLDGVSDELAARAASHRVTRDNVVRLAEAWRTVLEVSFATPIPPLNWSWEEGF